MARLTYKKTTCILCGAKENYRVIYRQNFSSHHFNTRIFSARRMPDRIHYRMVSCKTDGLVRSNPVLPDTKLYELYKKSAFTYHEEVQNLVKTYLAALKPVLSKLPKAAQLVEVGCGNGFVLDALYQNGYRNVYGIEPSLHAKKHASARIRKRIKTGVLDARMYRGQQFDCVFFFQTLDHIPRPDLFIRECKRLLKPGGYILAFNHNVESVSARLLKEKSPIIDIEHIYLFSPNTIRMLFEKLGMKVLSITKPWNTVSLRHIVWLTPIPKPLKNMLLSSSNKFIEKLLGMVVRVPLGNLCIISQKPL